VQIECAAVARSRGEDKGCETWVAAGELFALGFVLIHAFVRVLVATSKLSTQSISRFS
jgi:heme/copper-type cytochrome/quinol oxidase subunit 3